MTARPLREIAADVRCNWTAPNYAAVPYLEAMEELDKITDDYFADSAKTVVLYFLSNTNTWRGPEAKRIKTELRALLKTA